MGYTHYWKTKRAFTEKEWAEMTKGTKKIIKESNVPIGDGMGEGQPIITDNAISLNGKGANSHETFYVSKEPTKFDFCKTALKPYDVVVCACLLLMMKILGNDAEVHSDGNMNGADWAKGRELFKKVIKH